MRRYLARKRDTLNEAALPNDTKTELNHRTHPYSPAEDFGLATATLIAASVTLAPLVSVLSWLAGEWHWLFMILLLPPTVFYLGAALLNWVISRPSASIWTGIALLLAILVVAFRFLFPRFDTAPIIREVNAVEFPGSLIFLYPVLALLVIFTALVARARKIVPRDALLAGLACAALFALGLLASAPSHFSLARLSLILPIIAFNAALARCIACGYAHWCAVNPRNSLATMRLWRTGWNRTLLNYHVPLAALAATFWLDPGQLYRPLEGVIDAGMYHLNLMVFSLILSFRRTGADRRRWVLVGINAWNAAHDALILWMSYNRKRTSAAGVFQFPLVPDYYHRRFLTLFVLALNVAAVVPLVKPSKPTPAIEKRSLLPDGRYQVQLEITDFNTAPRTGTIPQAGDYDAPPHAPGKSVATDNDKRFYAEFLVTSASIVLLPALFLFSTLAAVAGPQLALYHKVLEIESQDQIASDENPTLPTIWDNRVERLVNSGNSTERQHIYAGHSWVSDYPILVHRDLLNAHAHIVGDSGSGKTALGIAPLMTQLIARADASHVIIDLKGDPHLFQCAWIEAERAGLPFKYFSTIPGCSSYVFNPFLQGHLRHRTLNQRVQNLLRSLSLDYGQEAYGRSYFSSMHETVLLNYLARYRDIHSFRDLYRYVSDKNSYRSIGDLSEWTEARHLIALLNRVAAVEPLNISPCDISAHSPLLRDAIDMANLPRPEHKQVVYFYLPALEESGTANAIAKLALFALLAAATRREPGRRNGRVYVFLDEFQVIVGSSAVTILEQARSMNVSLILSHQHRGQLDTPDGDLTPAIEANTRYKQIFKASDFASIQHLEDEGGEALYHNLNWQVPYDANFDEADDDTFNYAAIKRQSSWFETPEVGVQETAGPRLERNRIIELSAHPTASFIRFTEDKEFTQFTGYWTPIVSEFHIHRGEYQRREVAPWPDPTDATLVVPLESEHERRYQKGTEVDQGQGALFPAGMQDASPTERSAADAALKDRIRAISAQISNSASPNVPSTSKPA